MVGLSTTSILGIDVSMHPSERRVILSIKLSDDPEAYAIAKLDRQAVDAMRDNLEFNMYMAEETVSGATPQAGPSLPLVVE